MINILEILHTINKFIINNQMKIDKSVYFTVIAAQLTIYGIFLTFVQFIANIDNDGTYLAVEIKSFYISKKLKISKIIGSNIFLIIVLFSFLVKPILIICNTSISETTKSCITFGWYTFVIIFMVLFACTFVKCTKLTMKIKSIGQNSKYNLILKDIEEDFVKRRNKKLKKELEIIKLQKILRSMKRRYEIDDNCNLLTKYNELTITVLTKYYERKEYEINLLVKKNVCVKNQKPFEYNFKFELRILDDIIKDILEREKKDNEFIKNVFIIRMKILNKSLERKIIDEIKDNQSNQIVKEQDKSRVWLIYKILLKSSDYINLIKDVINMLYIDIPSVSEEAKVIIQYENRKEISHLLGICFELVCNEKMNEIQFIEIFDNVLIEEDFKKVLMQSVIDVFSVDNKPRISEKIIKRLDEHQRVYILAYLLIYHSIYDFREEWKHLELVKLRMILPFTEDFVTILDANKEYIISRFENSIIRHRFNKQMVDVLIHYLRQSMSQKLVIRIFNDNIINVFYLFVFKVVILKENVYYTEYDFSNYKQLKVRFVRFLSEHPELFEDDEILKFLYILRNNTFSKEHDIDIELKDDFSCLILANITITADLISKWSGEGAYVWSSLVKYLLVKTIELEKYNNSEDEKWVIKNVKQDFVGSNKSVDVYVQDITDTYEKYHLTFSYVQKENISRFIYKCLMGIM